MNISHEILDNFWFPAHLMDLLHHADQLSQPNSSGNQFGIGMDSNNTDSIHTGILKALNQQTAGSFVAHGLNVTQNGSTFAVSSGGWFDKGEYKTGTPTAVNDNFNS